MDLMAIRRSLLMKQTSRIPAEYQEVEWVMGANAVINLDYVPKINPKAVSLLSIEAYGDRDLMGFAANTSPSFIIDHKKDNSESSSVWYNRYGDTRTYNFGFNVTIGQQYLFEFGNEIKVDGTLYTSLDVPDWSQNQQSLRLLGARSSNFFSSMKVYTFALYDGTSKVRDLVPCYRKSDDKIGFYDLVSKRFFTQSAGTLYKGNDK